MYLTLSCIFICLISAILHEALAGKDTRIDRIEKQTEQEMPPQKCSKEITDKISKTQKWMKTTDAVSNVFLKKTNLRITARKQSLNWPSKPRKQC